MLLKKNIQTLTLLRNVISLLSDQEYQKSIEALQHSTMGKHLRHILDFYFCFVDGLESGIICYDSRQRNEEIEQNVLVAVSETDKVILALQSLQLSDISQLSMTLENEKITINTSAERELLYCLEHAIHHKAIIKIALHLLKPELNIAKEFGVAYSTLEYSSKN